jgi:two-component system response regulator
LNQQNVVDILLVEDNPQDVELTVRALKKHNITNKLIVLEDGAEALDFIFCRGKYEDRGIANHPKVILLDVKLPKVSGLEVLHPGKIPTSKLHTITVPTVTLSNRWTSMRLWRQ